MRIRDLAFKDGRAGAGGAWQSWTDGDVREIVHYDTPMLAIGLDEDGEPDEVMVQSLGRGSVSDQNGCNQIFQALGAPYYYRRCGGAHIITLPEKPRRGGTPREYRSGDGRTVRPGEKPDVSGLAMLGSGLDRDVYQLDETSVLKVETWGPNQTPTEIAAWERLKDTEYRQHLAEIYAADPDGWWVVMEFAPKPCYSQVTAKRLASLLAKVGVYDVSHDNVRYRADGTPVVVDLGISGADFASLGGLR